MKKPRKKILCVCSGGNVRSVSLAYLLKRLYKYDALACGIKDNSFYTLDYLYKWADRIIVLEEEFKHTIPQGYNHKILVMDIGHDTWHVPMHPQLMDRLYKKLSENKL